MKKLKDDLHLYKIVDINFGFKNHQLIKYLSERGEAIQKKDWVKLKKVEKKINKKIFDNFG